MMFDVPSSNGALNLLYMLDDGVNAKQERRAQAELGEMPEDGVRRRDL